MKSWRDYSSQLFCQMNCIYKTSKRVMMIDAKLFESIVSSKKSHVWTLRYWLSDTFRCIIWSWFDHLFEIIKRLSCRDIDMIIQINWFVKWIIFTKSVRHRTRHDIKLFSNQLYHRETVFVVLLIFRYFLVIRFVRDLFVYYWL